MIPVSVLNVKTLDTGILKKDWVAGQYLIS
jgi:hypothetical protein